MSRRAHRACPGTGGDGVKINDAHVHIWAAQPPYPEYAVIPRFPATVETLLDLMDEQGVARAAVVTPRAMGWDNSVTLAAANLAPGRIVPVGLINPEGGDPAADLGRQAGPRGLAGVRLSPFNHPGQTWLTGQGLSGFWETARDLGLPVHMHIAQEQLTQVATVAERFPGLLLVIDHLGRPDLTVGPDAAGFRTFLELSRFPGIWVKTADSGFFSRSGPPFADLLPFVRAALDAYGSHRLLWGSDWPLCTSFGTCADAREPWWESAAFLTAADRERIFRLNFDELYSAPGSREGDSV